MSISNFETICKLGEGSFSGVFKVMRKSDNQVYALKKVKLTSLKQKEKENSLNEVRILASINHPNIIAYKEAFIDEPTNTLCIIMELADHGDLLKKITTAKSSGAFFPEPEIWQALVQITQGLKSLHDKSILHRDLKCANIFISKEGTMKLGDLNVSKVNKKGLAYTQTGTPYYASPEVWQDKPYNSSSDIWSLGCVIYEMTALSPPFTASDMRGLYNKVVAGQYPNIPSRYSSDLSNTIRSMLQVNPKLRPTCDQILELPTVKRHQTSSSLAVIDADNSDLLGTIRFELGLKNIQKKLPASNYGSDLRPGNNSEVYGHGNLLYEEVKDPRGGNSERYAPANDGLRKGLGVAGPSKFYVAISNNPASNRNLAVRDVKEHVPVVKGELPSDPRSRKGTGNGAPYRESPNNTPQVLGRKPSLEVVRREGNGEHSSRSPPSQGNLFNRPPQAEGIYHNYPDLKPPQPNLGRDHRYGNPPKEPVISNSREGSACGRPNSNFGKIAAGVLQSPKNLIPKGMPQNGRPQRHNNLW